MVQLSWSFGPTIVYLFLMGGANNGQMFGVGWLWRGFLFIEILLGSFGFYFVTDTMTATSIVMGLMQFCQKQEL